MASKYAANTAHKFLQLNERTIGVYTAWDGWATAALVHPLFAELERRGNLQYWEEVAQPLQRSIIDMQRRGLLLDREALNVYRRQIRNELAEADNHVLAADTTGDLARPTAKYPNGIGAPKRLGKFLFETLGLRPHKKTVTDLNSTDQEALYRILRDLRKKDELHRGVLEALFHRSRLKTIYQRYLNLPYDSDGRVRPRIKMTGTKTWRFAYAEPPLHQWPPEIRHLFVAAPGHVFVAGDYSQLEARILAYLSGDATSIRVFELGDDVHAQNAMDLFSWGAETWQQKLAAGEAKAARNFAKTFLYGISYGGAAETMKTKLYCPCPKCADKVPDTLSLKRDEIKAAGERWFSRHSQVKRWHRELESDVRRKGYYESPLGPARRYLGQPWGSDLEREVKNLPMQFGAALLMNRRQVELDKLGAPLVLQMHDAFMLEVPEDQVDVWAYRLKETMEAPIPQLDGVVFPVDVEVGRTWGGLEPWQKTTAPA